ncbi:MAG: metallophosphoesterase [Bacteroidetes bacterium]|nr:metallophosphoesterase [Bacteroidota bacterium]
MRLLPILIIWFLIDLYAFQGIATITSSAGIHAAYWIFDGLLLSTILYLLLSGKVNRNSSAIINKLAGISILSLVPKLIVLPFLFLEDTIRVIRSAFTGLMPARIEGISELAVTVALITAIGIVYGLIKGKHAYRVHKVKLAFKDLPDAFEGFTITQLSDIHSGSFSNSIAVERGVEMANQQKSDVIVFTGDLVNNTADEMNPWISVFAKLNAPFGKFSILGNHDYGDYVAWESAHAKAQNLQNLKEVHPQIGFRLLLNENVKIEKNGQSISLIGVENWGNRGFAKYGDLNKALAGTTDNDFKILLSHDPSHWEAETLNHPNPIHLTLAGHTHGMQFGLEIFGFKWSPIKYIYRQWAGAYEKAGKYIYVNRGFGFLGFPGRVGILPEITVIELVKGKSEP